MSLATREPAEICIRLTDVWKIYTIDAQPVEALRGVSLTIPSQSIVAVTGKSGAGKSTLLNLIGTLDQPTRGRIMLNGTDIATMSDHDASVFRNSSIGFVFQMNSMLPEFTALENVMIPGLIARAPRGEILNRARRLLENVGLKNRENHRPAELSAGEQQRVAIARALLMAPPILLADEPTGNLDHKSSIAIQDLLLDMCRQQNVTMMLITHDLELAARLPQRIVMEDGKILEVEL